MKLFIDTSGSNLIFALIDNQNKIRDFFKYEVNNNATAISLDLLDKFLNKNKLDFKDIDTYFFTIGPGSFTGMRIVLNILGSILLVYKDINFLFIDTFSLLKEKGRDFVYIPFGKNKFYLKDYSFKNFVKKTKFRVVKELDSKEEENSVIGYERFDTNRLEYLLRSKKFKKVKSLDKVKLIYG